MNQQIKLTLSILFLISLTLPLIGLGNKNADSTYEARVIVTAKNMVDSGDWIVPYFNNQIRLQKPPLPYWTIASISKIFNVFNEWSFRLPSAIMGIFGSIITFLIARLMFGLQVGLFAGILQSMTIKYIIESRFAKVDIYVSFWIAAAFFILSLIFFAKKKRDWLWLFLWVAIGLAFLSKWFNVFVFILPPAIYSFIIFKDRRGNILWHITGIIIFALIALPWIALLYHKLGYHTLSQEWFHEINTNITAVKNRHRTQYFYYFHQIFVLGFPWIILILSTLVLPFLKIYKEQKEKNNWLIIALLGSMVILSLVSKKKVSYLLPVLPCLSILTANSLVYIIGILENKEPLNIPINPKILKFIKFLITSNHIFFITLSLAIIVYSLSGYEQSLKYIMFFIGLILLSIHSASFKIMRNGKYLISIIYTFISVIILNFSLFAIYTPSLDRTSSVGIAKEIGRIIGNSPLVYYLGRDEKLIYHLKRDIPFIMNSNELSDIVKKNPDTYVLVQEKHFNEAVSITPKVVFSNSKYKDKSIPFFDENNYKKIYLLKL